VKRPLSGSGSGKFGSKPLILKDWLGGLDSNQDSQSQSLESYQLDDLPAGRNKKKSGQIRVSREPRLDSSNLIGNGRGVNRRWRRRIRPKGSGIVCSCGGVDPFLSALQGKL
jgi:hypothetical protein